MRSMVLWVVALLAVDCSTSPMTGSDALPDSDSVDVAHDGQPDGTGGSPGCKLKYVAPGCGAKAAGICDDGHGGNCGGTVCDCQGRVQSVYCDRSDVPYAYRLDDLRGPDASLTCDPNVADGGH